MVNLKKNIQPRFNRGQPKRRLIKGDNVVTSQVKKILQAADQKLIVMVRG